ncbi:MAG TPA: hypothetical protein VF077_09400 [Nitrospiraceae bacterium]
MPITSIETTLRLIGGGIIKLNTIPVEGVELIRRWVELSRKPDPADPTKTISRYADSATSTEEEILTNFFNQQFLGSLMDVSSITPSQAVIDAQKEVQKAGANVEAIKKKEIGLL